MKKHVRIYLNYFDYAEDDFMPCEIHQNKRLAEVHHIHCRGAGGSKTKDYIENLMGLCRECHDSLGDRKQHFEYLETTHLKFMENAKQ